MKKQKSGSTIVRILSSFERAKTIAKSIRKSWFEVVDINENQSFIISFGAENGNVMYVYETSVYPQIIEIISNLK